MSERECFVAMLVKAYIPHGLRMDADLAIAVLVEHEDEVTEWLFDADGDLVSSILCR